MANQAAQLGAKHWKALKLIEDGSGSIKDIAREVGWSPQTLYALYEGNTNKVGSVGDLFVAELKRIQSRNSEKVKYLLKDNKKLALRKMNERLREIQVLPATPELSRELSMILNAIAKLNSDVELNQTTYLSGMSTEELAQEYKRIKSLVDVARSAD